MILDDVLQSLRFCFWELRHALTPEAGRWRLEREAVWLRHRLRRGYEGLLRQRQALESLTSRIGRNDKRVMALKYRVATYLEVGNKKSAYRQALDLDQLRQGVDEDRQHLTRLQRAYQEHVTQLSRMERRREAVETQLRSLDLRTAPAQG
jgi:chromosome segregation ATPase